MMGRGTLWNVSAFSFSTTAYYHRHNRWKTLAPTATDRDDGSIEPFSPLPSSNTVEDSLINMLPEGEGSVIGSIPASNTASTTAMAPMGKL
jgi:hypothetical protein